MMPCEYNGCRRYAQYHRPQLVDGAYNNLCCLCFERIYHGYPHHQQAWEKISPQTTPVNPVPTVNPVTEQPTLF